MGKENNFDIYEIVCPYCNVTLGSVSETNDILCSNCRRHFKLKEGKNNPKRTKR